MQTIAHSSLNPMKINKFFEKEIFPESELPHLSEICDALRGTFELVDLRNDRLMYASVLAPYNSDNKL